MSTAPSIEVCTSCAAAVFPPRLVCWHCHATSWRRQETPTARVEETTVLRYRIGAVGAQLPVAIATVVTDAGPRLVVRIEGPAELGDVVTLEETATGIAAHRPT